MAKTPSVKLVEGSKMKKHAAYMQKQRSRWTAEEVERNRELSKLRMRKRRIKLKQELSNQNQLLDTRQTRQAEQKELERKTQHAEYKRKYRSHLSSQKRRRIREKDGERKREKRIKHKEKTNRDERSNEQSSTTSPGPSCTAAAWKKMVYRAKKKLPKSPRRYAAVVKGLTKCVSPGKQAALREQGLVMSPKAKTNLSGILNVVKEVNVELQGTSNDKRRMRREFVRHFAERLKEKSEQSGFCSVTGIKRKYLNICSSDKPRKRRKDAVSSEVQESVQNFYESEETAFIVPDKKAVKKDLEPKQVMQMSLTSAWSKWKSENPGKRLSFDKFRKLRPKRVLTQKHRKLFQCLCEYCENVKLKLTAVNSLVEKINRPDLKMKNEYEAVSETLCSKEEEKFHKLSCIDRHCNRCGTTILKEKLRPLLDDPTEVKWKKWDYVKTVNPKTHKEISKRLEVEKSGSPAELIEELLKELEFLSLHLFEAQWQQQQFASLQKNLPENSVSITIDFGENYACFSQNEVQGAHWSKDSVTIHPCICSYKCPDDNQLVDECIDIISDDLNHDTHAVNVFLKHVLRHLKDNREVKMEHVYVISDGCASQYKCRVTFMDVSCSLQDHMVSMERCYYGSRHGKNRCDGEAGVLKSKATRDVKNRVANIYNARTFYDSVRALEKPAKSDEGTCLHKRRTLLFVSTDEIQHVRPERDCKTVPGTRKLHSALGVERAVIKTRRLSCFCEECRQHHYDRCLNFQYVDTWRLVQLKPLLPVEHPPAAGVPEAQPAGVLEAQPAGVPEAQPDGVLEAQQAGVPEAQPAGVLEAQPDGIHVLEAQPDGVPEAQPAGIPEAQPADMNASIGDISLGDISFTSLGDISFTSLGGVNMTSLLECLDTTPEYKEGEFVLVQLKSGKRSEEYVAEVKRLLPNNEVVLQYMEKLHGEEGMYRWPLKVDMSQENLNSSIKKIAYPHLIEEKSSSRIQVFSFES